MVFAIKFIAFLLIQHLALTKCQVIRIDSCKRDANIEEMLTRMKEMSLKSLKTKIKVNDIESELQETKDRLEDAEKRIARLGKFITW